MKSHLLLTAFLTAHAFAQPTLTLSPAVITTCAFPGFGRTRIFWNVPGADSVQLRAGGPSGTIMGVEPPQGSTGTGDWVQDGMVFALTTGDGQQLASATARVLCQTPSSSYFPLDVGNEWVYRIDNRFSTAVYQTRRVLRAEVINGTLYFIVGIGLNEVPYRGDAQGRVYYLNSPNSEQLLFDPTGVTSGALYQILTKGQAALTGLGNFADAFTYEWFHGLQVERGTYARGVGLTANSTQMLTGSSGGFFESYTLVYARIAGNTVFAAPSPTLELTAESRDFDVSGGHVTNCAVPCYFVACGLLPGADPPGTYKPCFQARVRLQESAASFAAAEPQARTVLLDLLDSTNRSVSGVSDPVTIGVGQLEAVVSHSIMLPTIPGQYRLRARIVDASNVETDSAFVAVKIR